MRNLARLTLLGGCIAVWSGALRTYFGADDAVLFRGLALHSVPSTNWRFLSRAALGLEWEAFRGTPWLWHLVQLTLHAACALALLELLVALGLGLSASFLGSALFAAHALSFGAVYPASGLGTLAGMLCLLGAGLTWIRFGSSPGGVVGSTILGILAVAFRETYAPGILVLPLLPTEGRQGRGLWAIPVLATLAAGSVLVVDALRGPLAGPAYRPDLGLVPAAAERYLAWLFGSHSPVPDVISSLGAGVGGWSVFLGVLSTVGLAGVGWTGSRRKAAAIGTIWLTLLAVPALMTPQHLYLYYLYGALGGFAVLAGAFAAALQVWPPTRSWIQVMTCAFAVALLAWGADAVRHRENYMLGETPFHADPFMRQQEIVRNFVTGVRGATQGSAPMIMFYPVSLGFGTFPTDTSLLGSNPITGSTDSGSVLRTLGGLAMKVQFASSLGAGDTLNPGFLYDGAGQVYPLESGALAFRSVADFWAAQNDWNRVSAALSEYVRLAPNDTTAWYNLLLVCARTGLSGETRRAGERFLQLENSGQRAEYIRGLLSDPPASSP